MCDTIYLKSGNRTFVGKNSDRDANEAHLLIRQPAKNYKAGERVEATYIEIPQVKHTYACVLLKPHWIWGAEMGWNEFGLNIGNEAVFSKVKREKSEGLIGMDLLRLGLERAKTPLEAIQVITSLIEEYGQDGNCGFGAPFYYHNAFLISNADEAYVLDTAGKYWAYRKVNELATISNCMNITDIYDGASEGFAGNFTKRFEEPLHTYFAGAKVRRALTYTNLEKNKPHASVRLMMETLRLHRNEKITVNKHSVSSVCMHAGGLIGSHTAGSYVGEINKIYFCTGSSTPCMSVFKPVSLKASALFTDEKKALEFWLKREHLFRHILSGNIDLNNYIIDARKLENSFINKAQRAQNDDELDKISIECFKEDEEFADKWLATAQGLSLQTKGSPYFKYYWNKKNEELRNTYDF